MYRELGEFTMTYSGVEFFLTSILEAAINGDTRESYIVLQGMSLPVKIRKLRVIFKNKIKSNSEFLIFLSKFEKVIGFRDKLQHWSHLANAERTEIRLTDIGRNPENIFGSYVKVSVDDLKKINEYLTYAHTGLFVFRGSPYEKFQIDDQGTLLPLGDPPLPKV